MQQASPSTVREALRSHDDRVAGDGRALGLRGASQASSQRLGCAGELDRRGAEHLRAVAQGALHDAYGPGRGRHRVLLHGVSNRFQEHVAGPGELAADDDQLGVKQVDGGRDRLADGRAGIGNGSARAAISLADQFEQIR